MHPAGVAGGQRQPGHRAAAGSEHVGGVGAQRVEDGGHVVGTQVRCRVLVGIMDRAAAQAPRVVGDDGVVGGHGVCQGQKFRGGHR